MEKLRYSLPAGFRVEIIPEDITAGIPKEKRRCPVAIAVNRAVAAEGGIEGTVEAFPDALLVYDGKQSLREWYTFPGEVMHWIENFDQGEPFNRCGKFAMTLNDRREFVLEYMEGE